MTHGILQRGKLCFWATRYDSMNDPKDFVFARDKIIPKVREYLKKTSEAMEYGEGYPYILSFTTHADDALMWRLYHNEICLEIDSSALEKELEERVTNNSTSEFYQYGKCIYVSDEDKSIRRAYNNVRKKLPFLSDNEIDVAQDIAPFIKHKNYKNEKEYRVVSFDYKTGRGEYDETLESKCRIEECEIPVNVKVKGVYGGDIILYKEFFFSPKILKRIIVKKNRTDEFEKLKSHIKLILCGRHYPIGVEVVQSKALNV